MLNKTRVAVLALLAINLVYNAFFPLHYDEAYYWFWSKHLAISYFDHPPMIAWLLALTGFLGDHEWLIRLVPFLCMTALGLVIWLLAKRAFDEVTADTAILFFMLIPITNIGFLLATPDAPLNLFWALCMYFAYKALFPEDRFEKPGKWLVLSGFFLGCAMLSKYTAVLLFPSLVLATIFTSNRKWYFSKAMFGAILLALLVFLPVILWNYQNEWASFTFQFNHGMAPEKVFNEKYLFEFLGGQAGSLSPLIFIGLLYALIRYLPENLRNERLAFFFWPCVFTLAFFTYAAMFKKSAANWAVPAYISGIILLSYWLERKKWYRYKTAAVGMALVMVILLRFPMLFPFLPDKLVFLAKLDGPPQVFSALKVDKDMQVLSDGYGNAALAAYYIKDKAGVDTFKSKRITMFDYWRTDDEPKAKALYIGERDEGAGLQKVYKDVQKMPDIEYTDKNRHKRFFVYEVQNPY